MLLYSKNNGKYAANGVVCFLLFFLPAVTKAQNLVPNPSFEEADTCLAQLGFYNGPLQWFSGGGTPDYFQSCVPYGTANSVPQSVYAFQYAQEGDAYVGMVTSQMPQGQREYPMVQLLSPLEQSVTYYVSFYANPAWNGSIQNSALSLASSHVGALFTMQPRPWLQSDPWSTAGNFAQVYHPWIISDTVGWTLVSGSFVADSAYQYVMIGNHFDNYITDTLSFALFASFPIGYTLVDNICVSTNPLGCPLASSVVVQGAEDIVLFPNPAVYELSMRGRAMDASASIYDVLGRTVWEGRITGENWHLDVRAWARGNYMLCMAGQEDIRTYKFVLID